MREIPVKTKWGTFLLEVTERGLYAVRFPGRNPLYTPGVYGVPHPVCTRVKRPLAGYFRSPRVSLAGIRLDLTGLTLFQRRVYQVLRRVPAGKVVTYSELAERAGYPGAARAVGSAMKKNRLPVVIPCHRVIPSSGGLGEYSAGAQWKRRLLEHEQHFAQRLPAGKAGATVNVKNLNRCDLRIERFPFTVSGGFKAWLWMGGESRVTLCLCGRAASCYNAETFFEER